jgi:hypothetical protein
MIPNKGNQISRLVDDNSKIERTLYEPVLQSYQDEKSSLNIVDSITDNIVKPIPSRIDYNFYNYCSICELKYPKEILRCKDCKQKVRTRPWHRSKIIDQKRI